MKKLILSIFMVFIMVSAVFAGEWQTTEYDMETILKDKYPTTIQWPTYGMNDNNLIGGSIVVNEPRDAYTYNIVTGEIKEYTNYRDVYGISNLNVIATTYGRLIYPDGTIINIRLDQGGCQARDINDYNIAVGDNWIYSNAWIKLPDGTFIPIEYPGALNTIFSSINNLNIIVGAYKEQDDVIFHGLIYDYNLDEFTILDYPDAVSTSFTGINDDGEIIGNWLDSSGISHAFLYYDGEFTDFPTDTYRNVYFVDINNNSEILGMYDNQRIGLSFITKYVVLDTVVDYIPNIFKLMINEQTKLITTGKLINPEGLDLIDGKQVEVEFTVRYKGLKIDGSDLVISYDDIQEVIVNNQNSINIE